MVFPTTERLTPCLMGNLPSETRSRWKERYRVSKKYGIRAGFGVVTGTGLATLVKEAAKDGVRLDANRYLGVILINGGLTCITGGVPLVTNATKVVKYAKACHSVCAASWRATHNVQICKSDRDREYNSEKLFDITEIKGFSSLISDLFLDCEAFEAGPFLNKGYEISEYELQNFVKKTFLKLKMDIFKILNF